MSATTIEASPEPSPETTSSNAAPSSALGRYHPGLDGLRGVGMMTMLAYHSEFAWARGAFLNLSQFFTLSGFLITSLLLRAHDRGGVNLRNFWTRRFRRLMPAALLCLAVIVAFGATSATREQADALPMDIFAASTYWANWHFVFSGKSYVDLFAAPSPVQHFWSLAVEEQFYVFMPLALLLVLRWTRSPKVLGVVFGAGALASTAAMIHFYDGGASIDRIYYGTDTRMAELLAGALLAIALAQFGSRLSPRALTIAGLIGVAAYAITVWGTVAVPLAPGWIWQGGMLAYSFVSCAVILGIVSGSGPLPVALSWGPLPAIGRITYGLYLYHWPIFLWLTPDRTGLDSWPLFTLRVALTFALASLSYNLVETKVRDGAFRGLPRPVRFSAVPVAVALLLLSATAVSRMPAPDPFETIRASDASLRPPVTATDGVLDILVISDGSDQAVVDHLVSADHDDSSIRVTVGPAFECEGLTPAGPGQTCANWAKTWPELIRTHNPDLVLLYVQDWSPDDISQLSGPGRDQVAFVRSVMDAGLDLFTANGAPVLWASPGASLGVKIVLASHPFAQAMAQLEQDRDDLHHVLGTRLPDREITPRAAYINQVTAALVADAALYQRVDRSDLERVLVLGDSQARSLAFGLERWGASTHAAVVWNAATEGCGLANDGLVTGARDATPPSEKCLNAARSWRRQVDEFRPDVVIVLTSIWDLLDRELPTWRGPKGPGDPQFDDYLVDTYTNAVDTWTAKGATVRWLTAPCNRLDPPPGQASASGSSETTARTAHLNAEILPRVAAARPDSVELFQLDDILCPDGQMIDEIKGVGPVFVDGVHFSVDGAMWFARKYGEELIATR